MASVDQILARLDSAARKFATRDGHMRDMLAIREGRFDEIAPDWLPDGMSQPMAANFIDIAAQSAAEAMSPLPSFTCSNPNMNTDVARKSADKRTKIVNSYVQHSRLGEHNIRAADQYNTYGFAAYSVEPDFEHKTPCIYVEDVLDAVYANNRKGETIWFAQRFRRSVDELRWEWEEYADSFMSLRSQGHTEVEVIRYFDDHEQVLLVPALKLSLMSIPNPIRRCAVRVIERPGLGKVARGAYDDLPGVQLARFLMAKYTLETAEQVAHAPIAMPDDVQEMEMGAFSTIRTANPQAVRRVDLSVPNTPFLEAQTLGQELQLGARHSELRDGASDANIITGKGVQALMAGYDQKIKVGQGRIASALTDVIAMCLEMDEALWGGIEKSVRGQEDGAPFEMKYRPSRDIAGDYTCSVSYGMTAGLDPNRSLVFLLQALTSGVISTDTVQRQMPFDLNVTAEQQKISVENFRQSLIASVAGLAQAIPAMAMQGGDPSKPVAQIAAVIKAIQKGTSIEEAVSKAFEPAPAPPQAPSADPLAAAAGAAPQDPLAALLGGGGGAPAGPPGDGPPSSDILQTLAGLGASGNPQLSASVRRQQPV